MNAPTLLLISLYDRRPVVPLAHLLASVARHPAGAAYEIAIVVNRTSAAPLALPPEARELTIIERENVGMNIGAWDHGWRVSPDYSSYLFLQDDCQIVRAGWLAAFLARADEEGVGLIGESLNPAWDKPWDEIARERAGELMRDHARDGEKVERVELYRDFMARYGIDPGPSGRHLRSLIWFARRETLEAIDGFPIGRTYGECIAAEIAVSRKIEAMGLRVEQVASAPFRYIRHADWRRTRPGGPYVHVKSLRGGLIARAWRRLFS